MEADIYNFENTVIKLKYFRDAVLLKNSEQIINFKILYVHVSWN